MVVDRALGEHEPLGDLGCCAALRPPARALRARAASARRILLRCGPRPSRQPARPALAQAPRDDRRRRPRPEPLQLLERRRSGSSSSASASASAASYGQPSSVHSSAARAHSPASWRAYGSAVAAGISSSSPARRRQSASSPINHPDVRSRASASAVSVAARQPRGRLRARPPRLALRRPGRAATAPRSALPVPTPRRAVPMPGSPRRARTSPSTTSATMRGVIEVRGCAGRLRRSRLHLPSGPGRAPGVRDRRVR